MKWLACGLALALLLAATPAIGSFHTAIQNSVPDRVHVLAMSGTSFNGLHAPDTPVLEAYLGERVRFALFATEAHTFHVHGHPWLLDDGSVVDTFLVDLDRPHVFDVPAGSVDRHAGDWLYHCHFSAHVAEGMWGVFRVYPYKAEILPGTVIELSRLGEPVDDATLALTLDGVEWPAHVEPLGGGRYQVHAELPAVGAVVVTATHAELGTSVVRQSFGGAPLPLPTVGLAGHAHGAS